MRSRLECRRVDLKEIAWGECERGWFRFRPAESKQSYIRRVCTQAGIGFRETINVLRIRDALRLGQRFDPVILVRRGARLSILDGWHRVCAAGLLALKSVYAAIFEPATPAEENCIFKTMMHREERGIAPFDTLMEFVKAHPYARSAAHV